MSEKPTYEELEQRIQELEPYGVSLVSMDAGKVKPALQDGTVDAAIVPPLGAILLQWHTAFKQVIDLHVLVRQSHPLPNSFLSSHTLLTPVLTENSYLNHVFLPTICGPSNVLVT